MPYKVIVKEEARLDLLEAYSYYENQQTGLGEKFLAAVQSRMSNIAEHPEYYSYIDNNYLLRDAAINGFPYVIIYEVAKADIVIYAVHLTHKNRA
jgi:plasmid stabilization system protein ParE